MTSDILRIIAPYPTPQPQAHPRWRRPELSMSPRTLILLFVALTLTLSTVAQARPPLPATEQRLSLMTLLGRHHFEVDRKTFDRIGPAKEISDHLVLFTSNPKLRPTIRQRAIASLRVYPSKRIQKVLESLLYDPELQDRAGVPMRREAMRSLAIAFGAGAVVAVSNHREDSDAQIREGCAHALGLTRSMSALPTLEAWLHHEPELFVRLAVDKAIAHIRGRTKR